MTTLEGTISEERISAYLQELQFQCVKVRERTLALDPFLVFIEEMLKVGVPKDRIKEVLVRNKIPVSDKKPEFTTTEPLTEQEIVAIANQAYRFVKDHPQESYGFLGGNYEPLDLMTYRDDLDPAIGKHFEAHGIAKGTMTEQLRALVRFLTVGIDSTRSFHSMALRLTDEYEEASAGAMGAAGPYTDGGFIVLGHPDQSIRSSGFGAVLVNDHFYPAIPRLQKAFPQFRIIRADQMQEKLSQWLKEKSVSHN